MDYILYHANCQDGWVAAYVAKKKYPEARLVSVPYGLSDLAYGELFNLVYGKDVIMLDYSFPTREKMQAFRDTTKSLIVLDHHVSKKDVLAGFDFAVFDNERSGAGLAWDYLFGYENFRPENWDKKWVNPVGLPRPWWVDYTEDQDLWSWKLHNSRCVNAFLMVQSRDVQTWDIITDTFDAKKAAEAGQHVDMHTQFCVRDAMRNIQSGRFHGHEVGVLNTSVVVSETGEAIYNAGYEIAVMWHEDHRNLYSFGLRSTTVDVGAIAKQYGGGGHKAAAGFEVNIKRGREILDAILGRTEVEVLGTSRCC